MVSNMTNARVFLARFPWSLRVLLLGVAGVLYYFFQPDSNPNPDPSRARDVVAMTQTQLDHRQQSRSSANWSPKQPALAIPLTKSVGDAQRPVVRDTGETQNPTITSTAQPPQTLDQFRKLAVEEAVPTLNGETMRADQAEAYNEALLQRALEAIRSEHHNLHAQAMDQLASLSDARASFALMDAIARSAGVNANYRFNAVSALARYAEAGQFSDVASIDYIQQLMSDSDSDVRMIARQVIDQMKQAMTVAIAEPPEEVSTSIEP